MQLPRVALLIETSNAYARGLLHGVVSYLREHGPWSIHLAEHGRGDVPPAWLPDWDGEGVIARIENPAIARAIRRLRAPVVDVSAAQLVPNLPWLETDDDAIARLAIQHLSERGFRNFAYCGDSRFNWSNWRGERFRKQLAEAGHSCAQFKPRPQSGGDEEYEVEEIGNWLSQLPQPVGVLACYDFRGRQVLDACRRRGIAVPEKVAVIGVDNDELLCSLCTPPLTSIIPNTHRTGYEAAELLDRMMRGAAVDTRGYFIEPLGIATRQSTDIVAIDDVNVSRAVRYIRDHACEGIRVKDLLQAVPQSRRVLESRFQKFIGRTPHEEILRVQLDRARSLLTETDLPLTEVAEQAGFSNTEYLSVVFKKHVGTPPGRYRNLNRP